MVFPLRKRKRSDLEDIPFQSATCAPRFVKIRSVIPFQAIAFESKRCGPRSTKTRKLFPFEDISIAPVIKRRRIVCIATDYDEFGSPTKRIRKFSGDENNATDASTPANNATAEDDGSFEIDDDDFALAVPKQLVDAAQDICNEIEQETGESSQLLTVEEETFAASIQESLQLAAFPATIALRDAAKTMLEKAIKFVDERFQTRIDLGRRAATLEEFHENFMFWRPKMMEIQK